MANPVLLNNVEHADLRVATEHGAAYGDQANQIAIFPTEFEAAAREFPILFRRVADGSFTAVVLLGLDRDENLFFENGGWTTRAIPVVQQRGPFSIGVSQGPDGEAGEPLIHVDLDDPRVGRENGQPLFRPHGGNSPYLEAVAGVLQMLYAGIGAAPGMFAAFEAESLIEPVTLDIEVAEGRRYQIPDCFTIDQRRLAGLDGAALERLHRGGYLALAFAVVSSLRNISRLIDLKSRRDREEEAQ